MTEPPILGLPEERRSFTKYALALMVPLALQNLINVAVQMADIVMLTSLGEIALSAANLGGQPAFIINLAFFGLASGMVVLTAQYWGKRDLDAIERVWGIALRTALIAAAGFCIVCSVFPGLIMRIYSSEEAVRLEGAKYMRILSFTYIFQAFTVTYLFLMRSMRKVKVSTYIYLISLFVNIGCNYVLIFGKLGLPAMGVTGAAIGTLIARVSECAMAFVHNLRFNRIITLRLRTIFLRNRLLTRDFFAYSSPVILNELLWGGGASATNAIVGQLGSVVTAANSIASIVRQLALVLCFGIAGAGEIILGNVLGSTEKDSLKKAWIYAKRLTVMAIIGGLIGSLVLVVLRPVVVGSIHTLRPESLDYLNTFILIITFTLPLCSFNCLVVVGALRAGGDTKVGLVIDTGALWLGGVGLGCVAAFVLKLPVWAVFLVLLSDELIKLPFCIWRFKTKKWINNITREDF